MKIGDVEWRVTPLIGLDGTTIFGYEILGQFHEFKRVMDITADSISRGTGDPIEAAMRRLAYELSVAHSQGRGHL